MDYQDLNDIAKLCATNVHPETIIEIAKTESGLNQFAVNVNGIDKAFRINKLADALEVIELAKEKDKTFDVGLMQINSRNLDRFGIKPIDAFEPCLNIRVGGIIISEFYRAALKHTSDPQIALQKALSAYNTGSLINGFGNGYVEKYYDTPALVSPKQNPEAGGVVGAAEATKSSEEPTAWQEQGNANSEVEPETGSATNWGRFLGSE